MFDRRTIMMAPVRFVDSILDRITALVCALIFAQFPQYLILYLQRLGGHVDEAARGVEKYREIARDVGMSLQQYVQHLLASKDAAIIKTGQKAVLDLERYNQLSESLRKISEASACKKFFVFLANADWDIAGNTWRHFTPGLPITFEAAAYAAVGIVLGMALYFAVSRLIILAVRRIAARRKRQLPTASPIAPQGG